MDLKRDDGKWRITEPKPLAADQDAVSSMVTSLSSLTADKTIEDNATDLQPYGLANPSLDSRHHREGRQDRRSCWWATTRPPIPAPTPSWPATRTSTPSPASSRPASTRSLNDLRDKRLLTFDPDKLTRVELAAKGAPIEFGKNGQNEWQILKPRPLRADGTPGGYADQQAQGRQDGSRSISDEDAKKAAAAFASGAKVAVATVTDSSGTQTLEVRKDKDKNYYAKSSVVEGVYKIPSDIGDALDKGLDDFRNKKLFDFGFSDPTKIELKSATYTKSGDKWMSGAKTMDNATVQILIDKLRDLTATKFADTGGGAAGFRSHRDLQRRQTVEKVTIRKQGDRYFAQREGEPSIYELDAKAVEDLQAAAAAIKEAAPEPAKKK